MKIIKDEFDTSILGQHVYKITLDDKTTGSDIERAVHKIDKGIIFCFTPLIPSNVTVLEGLGFHLVSIRSTYKFAGTLLLEDLLPEGYSIRPFDPSSVIADHDIHSLAQNIYIVSRYHKDRSISKNKSMEIYIQWVKNSLYKGYADRCFIARHSDTPMGICTVKIKEKNGYIDLLGVLPGHQSKKIGTALLSQGVAYLQSRKVSAIYVVTEGENIRANIFYQKNHFVIHGVDLVYHKHV